MRRIRTSAECMARTFLLRIGFVFLVVAGCQGVISDAGPAAGTPDGPGRPGGPQDPFGPVGPLDPDPMQPEQVELGGSVTASATAGPAPLRRLTRREYLNTVRDLLGSDALPTRELPPDSTGLTGFETSGLVTALEAERFQSAAEEVAEKIKGRITGLVPCDTQASGEEGCARQFVSRLGLKAFRRPLVEAEIDPLLALYRAVRSDIALRYGHADALKAVLQAMLQAPQFVYHWESGPHSPLVEHGFVRLSPYEVASRLSYFFWGTMPDEELFAAAASGNLYDLSEVERQSRRLLADARAATMVGEFHVQWLHLQGLARIPKDGNLFPEFTSAMRAALEEETRRFASHVVLEVDGVLSTLLTAPFTFMNETSARIYGVSGVTGQQMRQVSLEGTQRAGLFTQPSFLAVGANAYETYPHLRGLTIREKLLCTHLPAPMNVPPLPSPRDGVSTRERFEEHMVDGCWVCHQLMDPIGFGFEGFDAIGRARGMDAGKPVRVDGVVYGLDGTERSFHGPVELAQALAASPGVRDCVTRQWFRFVFGREEVGADRPSLVNAYGVFRQAGFNVRELMVAIAMSKSFLFRAPAEGEVL